jgi:hypothetical protein
VKRAQAIPLILGMVISGCGRPPDDGSMLPEGTVQHVVRSDEMEWRACPATLPAGCEIAVLEGNPQAPGPVHGALQAP